MKEYKFKFYAVMYPTTSIHSITESTEVLHELVGKYWNPSFFHTKCISTQEVGDYDRNRWIQFCETVNEKNTQNRELEKNSTIFSKQFLFETYISFLVMSEACWVPQKIDLNIVFPRHIMLDLKCFSLIIYFCIYLHSMFIQVNM